MLPIAPANIIFELICFTAFAMICGGLLKSRFSVKTSLLITAVCLAVVAGIQTAILLAPDGSLQLVLTLLPATAYLPVILTVHLLSKNGFATAVANWSLGVLAPYILNLFRDLLQKPLAKYQSLPFDFLWLTVLCSLVLAAFLVFTVLRFCRKPFGQFVFHNKYVWLIVPVIFALSLVSYVENINFTPILAGILFLNLLSAFLFVVKFLNVAMSEQTVRASERAIAAQLELQREEIEQIRQKVDQGRIYRHDMRHHLSVLEELADCENADGIRQYIGDLNNRLSSVEKEDYCENTTINAVLTAYIGKAKQQDISVTVKARIPQELLMDEIDICTIMANALDNAIAACRENENDRWIELNSALHDNGSFSIDIRNACDKSVEFGKDGMPVSHKGEGHGLGMKSIDAVVQKYNGLLRCTCENQVFRFSVALFQPDNVPATRASGVKRAVSNTAATLLLLLCFVNIFPDTVQALETVPVIGNMLRMADFSTYHSSFSWGSSSLEASFPQIDSSNGIEDINQQLETYIQAVKEEFLWYFFQKYQGYVASDTDYNILHNDESLLSVCCYTTINAGGSSQYSRCFTLDKTTGNVLTLADLFAEGSDYIGIISADIIRQMTQQVEAGEGDYFIPGGIWSPEECFKAIAADQNFYIDENNKLIVIFDEYEVAPGSMGMPQFTVETAVFDHILHRSSPLFMTGKGEG